MKKVLSILPMLTVLFACSQEEPAKVEDQLVVEGWIEDGQAPVVYLTTTLDVSEEAVAISSLDDHLVKWAKVTISDGEEEVILTALASKRFSPPFAYTTGRMFGKVGKTYSLTVDYGDLHATAQATIPEPEELLSLEASEYGNSDGGYLIDAVFEPRKDSHYRIFCKTEKLDSTYLPAPEAFFDGAILESTARVRIQPPSSYLYASERTSFQSGETVYVKFSTMSSQMYDFWNVFGSQSYLHGAAVMSIDKNLPGNVSGGLGYFAGYGSTTYKVDIP